MDKGAPDVLHRLSEVVRHLLCDMEGHAEDTSSSKGRYTTDSREEEKLLEVLRPSFLSGGVC